MTTSTGPEEIEMVYDRRLLLWGGQDPPELSGLFDGTDLDRSQRAELTVQRLAISRDTRIPGSSIGYVIILCSQTSTRRARGWCPKTEGRLSVRRIVRPHGS
jgi:hypothetical protein